MSEVNHPSHYNKPGHKECIVEIEEQLGLQGAVDFCKGNVIKYNYRDGSKENNPSELDQKKAAWYEAKANELQGLGEFPLLEVVCNNAADLAAFDKEAFTKLRKQGLGASDSSIILGVNKWSDLKTLIEQKRCPDITDDERKVGEKVNVRKGADLEDLVLKKFCAWSGLQVAKPEAMFRLREYPYLTINYDGITVMEGQQIPVELKWVSTYACKYWNTSKELQTYADGAKYQYGSASTLEDHILTQADLYGVPPYYYTQVQQQMMGVNAPFAYLAALFDVDWQLHVFKIYKDQTVQDALTVKGLDTWVKINA